MIKGPLSVFGYNYLTDHHGAEKANSIRLLRYKGSRGSGGEYAYEALNLVDGSRTVQEIRDDMSSVYGSMPLDVVMKYFSALESIGIVREK